MRRNQRPEPFNVYEDDPNQDSATGSRSTESSSSGSSANSSVPDHHRAVAVTPHPYRRPDGRHQATLRALRANDVNMRQGAMAQSRGSTSSSSLSSSTRTGRSSTDGSASSISVGSSLFYHPSASSDLVEFPTSPSMPHYYERENLYPAPPEAYLHDDGSVLPSNNGTTVFGKRSKIKDQSSVARPLPVYSPQPVQPVYHQQAALQQPGFPHSPAPAQIPAPGSGSRPQDRRSQRDGHGQMYCRPPGISGSGAPPPPPPGPSAGSGLRVRPGSETGGLSVRPTSEDEGSRIDVVVMRPGKTKVAVKLGSLRTIVNELTDDDDEVVVVMTVPISALIDNPGLAQKRSLVRNSSSRRPIRPKKKKSKRTIHRNVPE
ncbi:hypothetical protein PRIPAC_88342 [Pristionchus pacificus]|uniref:Uncharacterized protein n=1 Tax=Pristionchus pacificus TaxID=54126 RepID=A0A2A6CYR6_PRIPA|nr:hypothetical protein PRIPAC_88342 [Pristionchus pacificus]|eukprot:PDM83207.1 hypothetical protein PRIPAC_34839 [Pristionchus pacificus]